MNIDFAKFSSLFRKHLFIKNCSSSFLSKNNSWINKNSSNISNILLIMIILITFFLVLMGIIWFYKWLKLYSLRPIKPIIQKPELVNNKFFISVDGYQLKWLGEVHPTTQKIILALHDWGMSSQNFYALSDYFKKNDPSVSILSFDQRNYGENVIEGKRALGDQIRDLQFILQNLKKDYPHRKIIILAEGKALELARFIMRKDKTLKHLIVVSFRNDEQWVKQPYFFKTFKAQRPMRWNPQLKTASSLDKWQQVMANNLALKGIMTVQEQCQWKHLAKINYKKGWSSDQKLLILQPENGIYFNPKKTAKILSGLEDNQMEMHYFANQSHFLLNEPQQIEIFAFIQNWAKFI